MIKKLVIPFIAVGVFIVAVGIFLQKTSILPSNQAKKTVQQASTVTVGNKVVSVDVARTSEEKEKGLGSRTTLAVNSGMLFVFQPNDTPQSFWMKGMLIPLDIIWIKGGKVIRIDKNIPAPTAGTTDKKLKIYTAGVAVDYVLEVNSGYSDTNSILVGDSVTFSGI